MDDTQRIIGLEDIQQQRTAQRQAADIQESLQKSGAAAAPAQVVGGMSTLQTQLGKAEAAKALDAKAGKRAKQAGMAKATVSKNAEVESARRIARTLAANGPISIDDVTESLVTSGREAGVHAPGDKRRVWKGSIFRTSEWVKVHEENARLARSHSRPIAMWALKSWIQANSLNGTQMNVSKFDLDGIRRDFERQHPKIPKDQCHWFVGTSRLADSVLTDIKSCDNEYQGVPVTFVNQAVGAILQYAPAPAPKGVQAPPTTLNTPGLK